MRQERLRRTIIRLRAERGWSQRRLARLSSVGLTTISRIERGELVDVSLSKVDCLAAIFNVSIDYLVRTPESIDTDPCQRVASFRLKEGKCSGCGEVSEESHTLRMCLALLDAAGRNHSYIASRFGISAKSVEFILREEERISRAVCAR